MNNLVVIEGPDQVGKTTIIYEIERKFRKRNIKCKLLSFPGKEEGTLGSIINIIHHNPKKFGVSSVTPASLQTLHVASHIDIIERQIKPLIDTNILILLDRYWWSTLAYGKASGISAPFLKKLIGLEKLIWNGISPSMIFLIQRNVKIEENHSRSYQANVWKNYISLIENEKKDVDVNIIVNEKLSEATQRIETLILESLFPLQKKSNGKSITIKKKRDEIWSPAKPTKVLDTYWYFATERQNIFFKRFNDELSPWSKDKIFNKYKFTNAYRASDRVSQYLIKNVIYSGDQSNKEVFFRIVLFKLFNKIETWEVLLSKLGSIKYSEYSFELYNKILNEVMNRGHRIYSAAYMMSSGSGFFGFERKHSNHLKLIELMMTEDLPFKIEQANSMMQVFELLRLYPTIGDFLAYQLTTDINYSNLTDFSEMSFVVPGPGALDGIRKCFTDLGGLNEVEIISLMAARQDKEFERLELSFKNLWGRKLQLIDCQNLFCEVDKYSRVAHPEISGISGRTRIKQILNPKNEPIEYWYPPKWGINDKIKRKDYSNGKLL